MQELVGEENCSTKLIKAIAQTSLPLLSLARELAEMADKVIGGD